MKKSKHIHKYILVKSSYTNMWKCAIAGCTHIMFNHLRDAMIGRFSICNGCGIQFIITESDLNDEFPKCLTCKSGIDITDMDELLKEMGLNDE